MTAEAIATGVVAGLIALLLAWLVSRAVKALWTWASKTVASAWRRLVTSAVEPPFREVRREFGDMKQTMKRIDSVLAALQLRVHEELSDRHLRASGPTQDSPDPSSRSGDDETADVPQQEEADDGAP